jgi:hypothetical protein
MLTFYNQIKRGVSEPVGVPGKNKQKCEKRKVPRAHSCENDRGTRLSSMPARENEIADKSVLRQASEAHQENRAINFYIENEIGRVDLIE